MRTSKHLVAVAALAVALTACLEPTQVSGPDQRAGTTAAPASSVDIPSSTAAEPATSQTTSSSEPGGDSSAPTTSGDTTSVETPTTPTPTAVEPETTPASDTTEPPAAGELWTVVAVIDGDTFDVAGPDGTQRVRLIGINTPETGECWSDDATAALDSLIAGRTVTLVRDVSDSDRYGRWLRYIEIDGLDVGAELVAGGHAIARRYDPDTARHGHYEQLQNTARDAQVGLWASDACGGSGDTELTISVRWDADGNDNDNLNDEWVAITNTAASSVDMSGWQIADESASNRYTIQPVTLNAGDTLVVRTGCGTSTGHEQHWCSNGAVWNNSGDTVFVRNPEGSLVTSHTYTDRDTQAPPR